MKKDKIIIIVVLAVIFLFLPFNSSMMQDGGSKFYSPFIGWYEVIDYHTNMGTNGSTNLSRNDPNYVEPTIRYVKVGRVIKVFGMTVYDTTHEVEERL